MRQLSDYERGFIGAVIDTDGHIVLSKVNNGFSRNLGVGFSNNSIALLKRIQEILGVQHLKLVPIKGGKCHKFRISPKISYELLKQLTLVVKEKRRVIGIKHYEVSSSMYGTNQYSPNTNEIKQEVLQLEKEFYIP